MGKWVKSFKKNWFIDVKLMVVIFVMNIVRNRMLFFNGFGYVE